MNHLAKSLISGAILAIPLFTTGCVYETYPHYRHYRPAYSSYYRDDDDYYRRDYGYRANAGAVWVRGHWRDGVWIRGHWE